MEDIHEPKDDLQQPIGTPSEIDENLSDEEKDQAEEEEMLAAAAKYKANHPRDMIFSIVLPRDQFPRRFIGKVGSLEEMMKFGELFDKKNSVKQITSTAVSFVRRYVVWPELSDEDLYDKSKFMPGHVIKMMEAIQKAGGFKDEAEIKKL